MMLNWKHLAGAVALVSIAAWSGCATYELRTSFSDYGEVYAESQNHQLLLNLARLSEHHPAYFFQMGQISATYKYDANVGFNGKEKDGPPFFWTWGASAGASRSKSPSFTFIPLVGGEFAAHLMTPIRADTFHALLREGFPLDILMRALVQQLRYNISGDREIVLYNAPTEQNKTNYATFLRVCDVLRELQERGYLANRGVPQRQQIPGGELDGAPTDKQVLEALGKDLTWYNTGSNRWVLTRERTNTLSVQLVGDAENFLHSVKQTPLYASFQEGELIDNLAKVLQPTPTGPSATLQFRSFHFMLANMAAEQEAFEKLMQDPSFVARVPQRQLRPILQMNWHGKTNSLEKPLVSTTYHGKQYEITDPKDGSTYNRDAFLLASSLMTQLNIDPAKITYQQQFLQIR